MEKDQRDLILAFNANGVQYLVIGGHAVGAHSEPRGTKDLDVFIKASAENSEAVFKALAEFGAPLAGVTPADFNDKASTVFQLGVISSGHLIQNKLASGRYQDLADVEKLRAFERAKSPKPC
jgi:hypothetical protein